MGGHHHELEVRYESLTGPAPLELATFFLKDGGEEIRKEAEDFTVSVNTSEKTFRDDVLFSTVVSFPPCVTKDVVTASPNLSIVSPLLPTVFPSHPPSTMAGDGRHK